MLLEVVLSREDEDFGPAGSDVLVNDSYIVAIKRDGDTNNSVLYLDLSDIGKYTKIYVEESYEKWYMLRLNV